MVFNWIVAKVSGVATVNEYCRDGVVAFLKKHAIEGPSFEFVTGGRTDTNPRCYNRVYFGTGDRKQHEVAFLLNVNEDFGSVYGAIVKDVAKDKFGTFHREWSREEPYLRDFGLYSYVAGKLGKIEDLD